MDYNKCIETIKAGRKEEVVKSAAELFLQNGIENVKMTDIAVHCGIGVASLYRYFGTKASIVIAAGSLLWKDAEALFRGALNDRSFNEKNGMEQLAELLGLFKVMYRTHNSFLRFTYDFDKYILSSSIDKSALADYEKNITVFYPYFEKSIDKGQQDGTLKKGLDYRSLYLAVTHALLAMCQKFICGEVLESDDFSNAEAELDLIINMAAAYMKP